MDDKKRRNEELEDLKQEIDNFKKERERVKAIVGKIGGMPTFNRKLFNIIFIILVVSCVLISLFSRGTLQLAMIELAVVAVSAKLIILMHNQSRVNHFQLWIMSALEWRLNEIIKMIKNIEKKNKSD
tara:strand:+ start:2920 stop:3300 length:381 start_codon:yes stop_codon:yes gene_type:complete